MDVPSTRALPDAPATAAQRPTAPADSTPAHRFRPDVEGLRAVAVLAVLAYHAGFARAGGGYVGVDVFFVISGYLITGLLVREAVRTSTVSPVAFWARRAKRLLPLTVPVLVGVVVAAWCVLSPVGGKSVFADAVSAAVYAINWRLAGAAVDYSALGSDASPVQHFWSLAVEEQFYLIWPLVVLAVALWCRRRAVPLRSRLAVTLAALVVASFGYAAYEVTTEASAAYFSTFTRGWELGLGGLLALVPVARLGRLRRFATPAAAAGLGAIALAVVVFDDNTPFPGPAALLPVLGTAAVIAAGVVALDTAPARLLSLPPVRYVGRISYSWYLWHWPAITLVTAWLGDLPPTLLACVVALSAVPAILSHHLLEDRLRRTRRFARPGRALLLGVACTALSVLAGVGALLAIPTEPLAPPDKAPGAQALTSPGGVQRSATALRPVPTEADDDKGQAQDDGCLVAPKDTEADSDCVYGDPHGDTTVVLFGDSHALQYFNPMNRIAKQHGWRLLALGKSGCTPAQVSTYNGLLKRQYTECDEWRAATLKRIEREHPALIVTGGLATTKTMRDGTRLTGDARATALRDGYVQTLGELTGTGAKVSVLRDNPRPPSDIPSCVSKSMDDLSHCAFATKTGFSYEPVDKEAAARVKGVRLIDPSSMICRDGVCPAVIGNVLVYRKDAHLTGTYTTTLTPWLARQLPDVS